MPNLSVPKQLGISPRSSRYGKHGRQRVQHRLILIGAETVRASKYVLPIGNATSRINKFKTNEVLYHKLSHLVFWPQNPVSANPANQFWADELSLCTSSYTWPSNRWWKSFAMHFLVWSHARRERACLTWRLRSPSSMLYSVNRLRHPAIKMKNNNSVSGCN